MGQCSLNNMTSKRRQNCGKMFEVNLRDARVVKRFSCKKDTKFTLDDVVWQFVKFEGDDAIFTRSFTVFGPRINHELQKTTRWETKNENKLELLKDYKDQFKIEYMIKSNWRLAYSYKSDWQASPGYFKIENLKMWDNELDK